MEIQGNCSHVKFNSSGVIMAMSANIGHEKHGTECSFGSTATYRIKHSWANIRFELSTDTYHTRIRSENRRDTIDNRMLCVVCIVSALSAISSRLLSNDMQWHSLQDPWNWCVCVCSQCTVPWNIWVTNEHQNPKQIWTNNKNERDEKQTGSTSHAYWRRAASCFGSTPRDIGPHTIHLNSKCTQFII